MTSIALLEACGFAPSVSDGGSGDGPHLIDASKIDAPAGADCFGTSLVTECLAGFPTATVELGNTTIHTDSDPMCAAVVPGGNLDACVVAGATIHVQSGTTVVVTGTRPLVLVAETTIIIDGTIDVASHHGGTRGAASDPAACVAGTLATKGGSGGGGAGGSFGGNGGNGRSNDGGSGGIASAAQPNPSLLRGGCGGGAGGGTPGSQSFGGGAVYVIAKTSITVSGSINASGAGGGGGNGSDNGGGGGGSGGMIGLDAPSIVVLATGKVFANGGGGGGGNGGASSVGGESTAGAVATGGSRGGSGGTGGNGAQGATLVGSNGANDPDPGGGGGGGGGGGAGVIKTATAPTNGGLISPAPT